LVSSVVSTPLTVVVRVSRSVILDAVRCVASLATVEGWFAGI
jgi:hypothetical protein